MIYLKKNKPEIVRYELLLLCLLYFITLRKVHISTRCTSKAQYRVAEVDWVDVLKLCEASQERLPWVSLWLRNMSGATLVSADRVPPPLGPDGCQDEENAPELTRCDRSWCGRPRPSLLSFPTLHHWSISRVTLLTRSFNLLQRVRPVEHISWGWEQTLSCRKPELISCRGSRKTLLQWRVWIWDLSWFYKYIFSCWRKLKCIKLERITKGSMLNEVG